VTANANPKLLNISHGLVVRNVKRNVGSGVQLILQYQLVYWRKCFSSDRWILMTLAKISYESVHAIYNFMLKYLVSMHFIWHNFSTTGWMFI